MLGKINVIKASGESVIFSYDKLQHSLRKAGANEEQCNSIIKKIELDLYDGITTKKIYQRAFSLLKSTSLRPFAARYKLKKAIMELWPSGYPFERYIAEIFTYKGFETKVGQIIQGHCVKHEVDVVAEHENKILFIECKYHKDAGFTCNIKTPLYINSRFLDIEKKHRKNAGYENKIHEGWLVTNTKFSTDSIQYGSCVGLNLLGWDYPQKESLRKLIDKSGLYPLTTLTTLNNVEKQKLLDMKLILCQDLLDNESILKSISISPNRIKEILDECDKLCH